MSDNTYDLVIVGAGPGGLTASIYAQRALLNTLLVEREMVGGQIALSDVIENYPGFPSISGMDLMLEFRKHAESFGLDIQMNTVLSIRDEGGMKVLLTTEGEIKAKAVILSTGAKPKFLGVPGEKEFYGKGVSTCATCDGPFFRGAEVLVVGGGDTAVKEAVYLSKLASKVTIVHRRDSLRAEKVLQKKALEADNIEILWSHVLKEVKGDNRGVTSVVVENLKEGKEKEVNVEGVFMFVGIVPATDFVDLDKDEAGFIITNQSMETSEAGIYAVGDCRNSPLLQVATAVGDGAIAAFKAEAYIEDHS